MNLARSATIARHDVRLLRAEPATMIILTIMPLILISFMAPAFDGSPHVSGGDDGATQAVPGFAVVFAFFMMGHMTFRLFQEHEWETWERLRASMASTAEITIGKLLVPFIAIIGQLVAVFALGVLLFGLEITGSALALLVVVIAFAWCLVALGAVWVACFRSVTQLNAAMNLATLVFAGLGGAIAPLSALPDWAVRLAPFTPSYWAMRGFHSVIVDGQGIAGVATSSAVLVAFSVGFFVLAGTRFRVEETKVTHAR